MIQIRECFVELPLCCRPVGQKAKGRSDNAVLQVGVDSMTRLPDESIPDASLRVSPIGARKQGKLKTIVGETG